MLIVLDEKVERRLLRPAGDSQTADVGHLTDVTAWLDEEEGLVRVFFPGDVTAVNGMDVGVQIPCIALPSDPRQDALPLSEANLPDGYALFFATTDSEGLPLRAFIAGMGSDTAQVCDIEVIRLETDVFSRLKGIFDTRVLAAKTVAVIGLGSGGSIGAVELAKTGIGNFILIDFDRLKAHNISRHVRGLADVGRYKTWVVRDAILQHNPSASVQCHEADVTQEPELLEETVSAADLVLVATDTQVSRYLINEACLASDTIAVYGGAYERAFAGEVVRVVPNTAGCYACVRQKLADTMRSISSQQQFDYTDDTDLEPEPGMGMDVSMIALLQAKMALATLLRGTGSAIEDIDADMIIWTNSARPEDGKLFEQPMARYFVRVPKADGCPACGEPTSTTGDETEGFQ